MEAVGGAEDDVGGGPEGDDEPDADADADAVAASLAESRRSRS
ncbi:hypothetical protein ACFUV1_31460 [Streptomyces griseoincarnatus]